MLNELTNFMMNYLNRFFMSAACVVLISASAVGKDVDKSGWIEPVKKELEGWTVHVDPQLLEGGKHAEEGEKALSMLGNHLERIAILMPKKQLAELKKLEIWIEHQHPSLGNMQYHPGKKWLIENGHDPRLVKKVHIPVAANLLSRQQMLKHPAVILHELAHAYHDQVLGFDHAGIVAAYKKAMDAGSYDKALLYTGEMVKHYGATNHKEYFAEATEAYFYHNDFYPFVRVELKKHDPTVYALMEEIWGKVN